MVKEIQRPWADLPPALLNSIYEKLPPSAAARGSGFGSACKSWRQFHAAAPLPPRPAYRSNHIPDKIRDQLQAASVEYSWPGSGWLLLRHSYDGPIFGCFNPLLPWPQNYIQLPCLTNSNSPPPPPIKAAAFSSDPAGPEDWTLLVAGAQGHMTFSALCRGDSAWRNYRRWYHWSQMYGGDCEGIGFAEGRFFCLFGSGDVLILGGGERRVLVADPLPARLRDLYSLRIVERGGAEEVRGSCVVVSWKQVADRHGGGGGGGAGRRWRLARVERRSEEEVERMVAAMEKERRWNLGAVVLASEKPYCSVSRI